MRGAFPHTPHFPQSGASPLNPLNVNTFLNPQIVIYQLQSNTIFSTICRALIESVYHCLQCLQRLESSFFYLVNYCNKYNGTLYHLWFNANILNSNFIIERTRTVLNHK